MPILNSEIKSYNIIYTGRKESLIESLINNNITQYIFLNDLLFVIYVGNDFNENIFDKSDSMVGIFILNEFVNKYNR